MIFLSYNFYFTCCLLHISFLLSSSSFSLVFRVVNSKASITVASIRLHSSFIFSFFPYIYDRYSVFSLCQHRSYLDYCHSIWHYPGPFMNICVFLITNSSFFLSFFFLSIANRISILLFLFFRLCLFCSSIKGLYISSCPTLTLLL